MSRSSTRSLRNVCAVVAAITAAACADSNSVTSPSSPAVSASRSPELNTRHVLHTREYFAKANSGARSSGTGIYYHGGPIIAPNATNVAAVYWSANTIYNNQPAPGSHGAASADGSLIGYFLAHLGGSAYFNINTTYYAGSTHVANAVNYTQYWATGSTGPLPSASPTDADMVAMLQAGFNSNQLTYNPSTVYAIFSGPNVNLGGGFLTQYCAYHTHGTVTINGVQHTVLYAAMPHNIDGPSACTSGQPAANGDPGADAEVNTLAHEIEESTTDELGTAWYDRSGYENADKCAWTFGTMYSSGGGTANITVGSKNFLVQQNWVNLGSGGCALHL